MVGHRFSPARRPTASSGFYNGGQNSRHHLQLLAQQPTGAAATKAQLKVWVDYANANQSVILFDSAYEAYITVPSLPHSIFEMGGPRRAPSSSAAFKDSRLHRTRCAYTVIRTPSNAAA
jgi:LL-diaminopimelate aminotransferase